MESKLTLSFIVLMLTPIAFPSVQEPGNTRLVLVQHTSSYNAGASRIVRAQNGSLLAVYGLGNVEGSLGSFAKYSDKGYSWTNSFSFGFGPSAMLRVENKIIAFYNRYVNYSIQEPEVNNCSVWKKESYDNGVTWVNDTRIDGSFTNYTVGTYQALLTQNGTVIYPISWTYSGNFWYSGVVRSDDKGMTWYNGGTVPNWTLSWTGLDEPSIVELQDHSLYCLMRTFTDLGKTDVATAAYSRSNDYGLTWTNSTSADGIFSFDTTSNVVTVSYTSKIVVAAWINRTDEVVEHDRTPLVVAYSNDGCSTWISPVLLDNSSSINDMSFFVDGGNIFLSYHCNPVPNGMDSIIQIFTTSIFGMNKADFNLDGRVNIVDCDLLSTAFMTNELYYDLNNDGKMNILDAILLGQDFGWAKV